jgi:parallel beta-helix repeat protein
MGDYGGGYTSDIYGITIRDLQFDGNRAAVSYNTYNGGQTDDAYQNGIRLQKCKRFLIEHCYIHDVVFNGISVYFLSNDGVIRDCLIKDIGKAGNPVLGAFSYMGIFVEYAADNVKILANTIDTTRDVGVFVQTATDGGIRYINIESNRILNCYANGIYVKDQGPGGTGPLQDIVVSKNIISGCATGNTEPAIRVARQSAGMRAYNIVITDNIVQGNNFNGILADTNTERCVISGNTVSSNLGIGITNAGTDVSVVGNICVGNSTDIIDISAATRASTSANIDRYSGADGQQGSFTPTVLTGGAAAGRTYSIQNGSYRVNGNRVEFNLVVALSAVGSSTGTLTIGGLPFASKASGAFAACSIVTSDVSWTTSPGALVINNESQVRIYGQSSGGSANALTDVNLSATSTFYISGAYEI